MSAWKEPNKKKVTIVVDGKRTQPITYKGMEHKNKDLKGCAYHSTWSGNGSGTIKIKEKEGTYEFKVCAAYKTGQKIKAGGNPRVKKPIPETCKIDSSWEFSEVRIFVEKVKMPTLHTCELDVSFSNFTNDGSPKDFDPWAMFNLDIRTGHSLMGKWKTHLHVCDLFAGKQKVRIK